MSNKNGKSLLPFELGEAEYFNIPVYPENLKPLRLLKKEAPETLAKLAKYFVATPQTDAYVIELEKFYGFTSGEEEFLSDNSAHLRNVFATFQELMVEIGKRTGATPEQVRTYCNNPIDHADKLTTSEVDKIMSLNNSQKASQVNTVQVTAVIQKRLDSTWTSEDTLNLPTPFLNKFLEYCTGEREGWKDKEEGKKRVVGSKLKKISENSAVIEPQTMKT